MESFEIKCPCCCNKLRILINETGDIILQSFDFDDTQTLQQLNCGQFGFEFGRKEETSNG